MRAGDDKKCYMHTEKHLACLSLNNGDDGCKTCAEPYVLKVVDGTASKNTCVWKIAHCIDYETDAKCSRCEHTHYLSPAKDSCMAKIHGCKFMIVAADSAEYDMLRPRCKTCLNDWYKHEGKCFYGCSNIKKVWDDSNKLYNPVCCTCLNAYRMTNTTTGICEKCVPDNCNQCLSEAAKCTTCATTYYLTSEGLCVK